MKSGMISNFQFEVPSNAEKSQYARLYGANNSWYADTSALTLPYSVDLANLISAPVYFQTNFLRPKKVSYVIIQGWYKSELFSQTFYLSYTNMKGDQAHYGETTPKVIYGILCQEYLYYTYSVALFLTIKELRKKTARKIQTRAM